MKTVLETIQGGAEYLDKGGVAQARLNMEHLLAKTMGCNRMQLYIDFDRPLEEDVLAPLRELVKRRRTGEPLQHLVGSAEFYGRTFRTDRRALIPRPETEEFVEHLLGRAAQMDAPMAIADIGCGSGVIGLTLAAELGDRCSRALLADLSPDALALALENAEALGIGTPTGGRVTFLQGDLIEPLGDEKVSLLAANLPYIPSRDLAGLQREVQFDPALALDGGDDGTELIRRLFQTAAPALAEGGLLAVEFGDGQAGRLREALAGQGFGPPEIVRDLSGTERFLFAPRQAAGRNPGHVS